MGTYTQHVFSIIRTKPDEDIEAEQKKLGEVLYEVGGYLDYDDLKPDGTFDDSRWSGGSGTKWYSFWEDIQEISKRMGDVSIYYWECCEDGYECEAVIDDGEWLSEVTLSNNYDYYGFEDEPKCPHGFGPLLNNSLKDKIVGDEIKRFYGDD